MRGKGLGFTVVSSPYDFFWIRSNLKQRSLSYQLAFSCHLSLNHSLWVRFFSPLLPSMLCVCLSLPISLVSLFIAPDSLTCVPLILRLSFPKFLRIASP